MKLFSLTLNNILLCEIIKNLFTKFFIIKDYVPNIYENPVINHSRNLPNNIIARTRASELVCVVVT